MKFSKTVLKKMSIELRTKTDEQLKNLYNLYNSQLSRLSEKDYDYYSEPLKDKINLIRQEMHVREVLKSNQV